MGEQPSILCVPDTHDSIERTSRNAVAVHSHGDRGDSLERSGVIVAEGTQTGPVFDIPQLHLLVSGAGEDESAVVGDINRVYVETVTLEIRPQSLAGDIPHLDRLVLAAGNKIPPILEGAQDRCCEQGEDKGGGRERGW